MKLSNPSPPSPDNSPSPPPMQRRQAPRWLAVVLLLLIGGAGYIIYKQVTALSIPSQAIAEIERRQYRKGFEMLQQYLRKNADHPEAAFWAARAARHLKDFDSAEFYLDLSEKLGWVENAILLERNLLRAQRGQWQTAEAFLINAIQKDHPDMREILEVMSEIYVNNFNVPMADRLIDVWIEKDPKNPKPYQLKAEIFYRLYNIPQMNEMALKAYELDPENAETRVILGKSYGDLGEIEKALEQLNWLQEHQVRNLDAYLYFARALEVRNRVPEATKILDQALSEFSEDTAYWQLLVTKARFEMAAGHNESAFRFLKEAYRLAPYEQEVNTQLGVCYQKFGKSDVAKEYLDRAQEIENGMKRMEALMKILTKEPNSPDARWEAGTIMLRNGQELGGLQWLNTALQFDPKHAKTHETLANYYAKKGNQSRAEFHRLQAIPKK